MNNVTFLYGEKKISSRRPLLSCLVFGSFRQFCFPSGNCHLFDALSSIFTSSVRGRKPVSSPFAFPVAREEGGLSHYLLAFACLLVYRRLFETRFSRFLLLTTTYVVARYTPSLLADIQFTVSTRVLLTMVVCVISWSNRCRDDHVHLLGLWTMMWERRKHVCTFIFSICSCFPSNINFSAFFIGSTRIAIISYSAQ